MTFLNMDELIDRTRRGEASDDEVARIDAWRKATPANERHYRETLRLIDAGRSLVHGEQYDASRPTAAQVIARTASRMPRSDRGRHVRRWAPWVLAAAAAAVAVVSIRSRPSDPDDAIPGHRIYWRHWAH